MTPELNNPPSFPLKPYKSPIPYAWMFFGLGTGNGLIWTVTLEGLLPARTAHIIIWSITFIFFAAQAIYMFVQDRRFKRWEAEYEKWLEAHGIVIPKR